MKKISKVIIIGSLVALTVSSIQSCSNNKLIQLERNQSHIDLLEAISENSMDSVYYVPKEIL